MASWRTFADEDPELAAEVEARFDRDGLVLVGTLRANGWPRISPVEPLFVDGELHLGMMWQSRKAVDLQRDPRLVVHSITDDKSGAAGDAKVSGRAADVADARARERYCRLLEERIGWRPESEFHLFVIEPTEVATFRVVDGRHEIRTWRAPV